MLPDLFIKKAQFHPTHGFKGCCSKGTVTTREGIDLLEGYDNYSALVYLKIHLTWGIRCYAKITTARIP